MRCPACGVDDDRVVDTRSRNDDKSIRRKRLCLKCGKRFFTVEEVEDKAVSVIKRDGRRELYDRGKLIRSIRIACTKRPVSIETIEKIADELETDFDFIYEIESRRIGERIIGALRQLDEIAYVRFASVYRNFRDKDEFLRELNQLKHETPGRDKEEIPDTAS
jgi:transcriptional repressor NrdR